MKKETLKLSYQHPEMKIVPLMVRSVLCNSTEQYEIEGSLGDGDFE